MFNSDEVVDTAFRERLQEQAATAGIALDLNQLGNLERYFRLLLRWNRTINLTALPLADFPDRTLNRLFIEPLQTRNSSKTSSFGLILVLGAGLPAIP